MLDELKKGLIRILDADGNTAGMGLLINEKGYILTASQVIMPIEEQQTDSFPQEAITFEFVGQSARSRAPKIHQAIPLKTRWVPFSEGNMAICHYKSKLPVGVQPYPIGSSLEKRSRKDELLFAGIDLGGLLFPCKAWLQGRVMDFSLKFETLKFSSKVREVQLAGSPILNCRTGNIIGFYAFRPSDQKVFIVPSEVIKGYYSSFLELEKAFQHLEELPPESISDRSVSTAQEGPRPINIQNFYAKTKDASIGFLQSFPQLKTLEGKRRLLQSLDVEQLMDWISSDYTEAKNWDIILSKLSLSKIDAVLALIKNLHISREKAELRKRKNELLRDWQKIRLTPYRFIFQNYLHRIISISEYTHLDRVYVDLLGEGQANALLLDTMASEQPSQYTSRPSKANRSSDSKDSEADDSSKSSEDTSGPKVDYILNIAKKVDRFIITGAPGSGKTVTVKKIAFQSADEVRRGEKDAKIPILVVANQFNDKNTIESLIQKEFPKWNDPYLDKSRLLLLIDGFNEINPAYQNNARKQILSLLRKEEEISFILSARKYKFYNAYNLPHFELKELQDEQVEEYIAAYQPQYKTEILAEIKSKKNEKIESLIYNPLTLFMIIFTFDLESKTLPSNRGRLFRNFISRILSWKQAFSDSSLPYQVKEKLLSRLAYQMRIDNFNPPVENVVELFKAHLIEMQENGLLEDETIDIPTEISKVLEDFYNNLVLKENLPPPLEELEEEAEASERVTTISFMHESFLEYFCSLEIQQTFKQKNKINIDFAATEWFETILMASDLFENESSLTKYLIFLYFGGEPLKVRFQKMQAIQPEEGDEADARKAAFNNEEEMAAVRQSLRDIQETVKVSFDYNSIFYERIDIACKTAFNIKNNHPAAYEALENLFLKHLSYWKYFYLIRTTEDVFAEVEETEPPSLNSILMATGGLSSEKVFTELFHTYEWMLIWLKNTYPKQQESRPRSNANQKAKALISNLSDFYLLYDFLKKEPDTSQWGEVEHLVSNFCNQNLGDIDRYLKNAMPLKLKQQRYQDLKAQLKKLSAVRKALLQEYQTTLDAVKKVQIEERLDAIENLKELEEEALKWLQQIGRQDPEYYIANVDTGDERSIENFVNYIPTLSYNPKVQEKLLSILFKGGTKLELQLAIVKILIKNYYQTEEVLKFVTQNYEKLMELQDFSQLIQDHYLLTLPQDSLTPKLQKLFIPNSQDSLQNYLYSTSPQEQENKLLLVTDQEKYSLIRLKNRLPDKIIFTPSLDLKFKDELPFPKTGQLILGPDMSIQIPMIHAKLSKNKNDIHLYFRKSDFPVSESLPHNGMVEIVGYGQHEIKGKNKGKLRADLEDGTRVTGNCYSVYIKKKQIFPKEGTLRTTDGQAITFKQYIDPEKKSRYCIHLFSESHKTSKNTAESWGFEKDQEVMLNQLKFVVTDVNTVDRRIRQYDIAPVHCISQEVVDPSKWYLPPQGLLHPDSIANDEHLIQEIRQHLEEEEVELLINELRIKYLFHEELQSVDYGITLKRVATANQNQVVYYSNGQLVETNLPAERLSEISENTIIVIDKGGVIHPVVPPREIARAGFEESFIDSIKYQDRELQYIFIFNPDGKDYFLHHSRITSFIPKRYDRVSFYPCQNYSSKYRNFPMARLIHKIEEGDETLRLESTKDQDAMIQKYASAIELYRNSSGIPDYEKNESIAALLEKIANCFFRLKEYRHSLDTCEEALYYNRRSVSAKMTMGNCFMEQNKFTKAIKTYKDIWVAKRKDMYYIDNLAFCHLAQGQSSDARYVYNNYFDSKDNEFDVKNIELLKNMVYSLIEIEKIYWAETELLRVPLEFKAAFCPLMVRVAKGLGRVNEKEKHERAFKLFEQIEEYSSDPIFKAEYAAFFNRRGEYDAAQSHFNKARSLTEEKEKIELIYLNSSGKYHDAWLLRKKRVRNKFESFQYANVLFGEGQYERAYQEVESAKNRFSDCPYYLPEFEGLQATILKRQMYKKRKREKVLDFRLHRRCLGHLEQAIEISATQERKMKHSLNKAFLLMETDMQQHYEEVDAILKEVRAFDLRFKNLMKAINLLHSGPIRTRKRGKRGGRRRKK